MKEFDSLKFRECAREALRVSSSYIRDAILGYVDLSDYLIKGDKTAVTVVDKKSQELARLIIQRDFGMYRLNSEEAPEETGKLDSPIVIYHDPIDGTGGFLMGGPTPTVIMGAYDSSQKSILACATMEPVTGRFWFSALGQGAYLNRFDYAEEKWDSYDGKQIHVNSKQGLDGSHVLVDVDHGFQRKREGENRLTNMLHPQGRRKISAQVEEAGGKVASFYTNGGHYALVAMGNPTLVGNITTAIGGHFDIAGMLHVVEAGGIASGYCILPGCPDEDPMRSIQSCGHDLKSADLVIAANNIRNFNSLQEILANSV